jgi:hypothetical protein
MSVSMRVRSFAFMAALAALGACSDSPISPKSGASRVLGADEVAVPSLSKSSGGNVTIYQVDSNSVVFQIDPRKNQTVAAGGNSLVFPAHSICDPETSGYGVDLWDAPCKPLTQPIWITANYSFRDGHAEVDFQPALRFAPASATDQSYWVILTLQEKIKLNSNLTYAIRWLAPDGTWIDESLADASMRAWTDKSGNKVSRRIKHFSGYNVTAGYMDSSLDTRSW